MTSVSFALVADTCVTVVHDGVVCNTTHALTAMAAKHQWHPSVAEMHGCRLPDDDPAVKVRQLSVTSRPDTSVTDGDAAVQHTGRALLLVRYMGWFWGHFCQDLLHKLAFAADFFEERRGNGDRLQDHQARPQDHQREGDGGGFKVIMESRSYIYIDTYKYIHRYTCMPAYEHRSSWSRARTLACSR